MANIDRRKSDFIRIRPNTKSKLIDLKKKNRMGSVGQVVDDLLLFKDLQKKKKFRKRIIEEVEF